MTLPSFKRIFLLITMSYTLAGCQQRLPLEITRDLIHSITGGEIHKLRPPAPGFNDPYPSIGHTPTITPEFPSPDARIALTTRLESQRNYAHRLSASTGAMPDQTAFAPPPPTPENGNSLIMMSTPQKPENPAPQATPITQPVTTGAPDNTHTEARTEPTQSQIPTLPSQPSSPSQIQQPQVIYLPVDHPFPDTLPDIAPMPEPITFPGFKIPITSGPIIPDFDTNTPAGTLIRFKPASDHPETGQKKILWNIVHNRKERTLTLYGFGASISADAGLNPEEQNHEITLGLLRARALAQYFVKQGVPPSAILLKAEAIGDGVRVTY